MSSTRDALDVLADALKTIECMPADLSTLCRELRGQHDTLRLIVDDLNARLQSVEEGVSSLATSVTAMTRHQERLSDEHYQRHVLDPVVGSLFPLVDLTFSVRDEDSEFVTGLRRQLIDTLERLGMNALAPHPGEEFCASTMKPCRTLPTPDAHRDQTVCHVNRLGFRRGRRVLRPAHVTVLRYEPTHENLKERNST